MNLRTRLLLGYGYLIVLLLAGAVGAALGYERLASSIERLVSAEYASMRSTIAMLDALDRMESRTFDLLLGTDTGLDALVEASAAFETALASVSDASRSDEERRLIDSLRVSFVHYRESRDVLLRLRTSEPLQIYRDSTLPRFREVRLLTLDLLEFNERAMVEAEADARHTAHVGAVWLAVLATLALFSFGFLTWALQRHFLARLASLQRTCADLAAGDRVRRVPPGEPDELGLIARELNRALDRQSEGEARLVGQLNERGQQIVSLLSAFDSQVAMLALDGDLLGSTLDSSDEAGVRELSDWVRNEGHLLALKPGGSVPAKTLPIGDGRRVRLRLLRAHSNRPIGWLARILVSGAEPASSSGDEGSSPTDAGSADSLPGAAFPARADDVASTDSSSGSSASPPSPAHGTTRTGPLPVTAPGPVTGEVPRIASTTTGPIPRVGFGSTASSDSQKNAGADGADGQGKILSGRYLAVDGPPEPNEPVKPPDANEIP